MVAELDAQVVRLTREYLPEVHGGAFDDPRVELIIGDAALGWPVQIIGEGLLWLAAALTLLTGYDYFRVGLKHMKEDDRADAKK